MAIFITGDTHGDFIRFKKKIFYEQAELTKDDCVMNDPTQFEQIVVSCSDWVGSFFACSPCVSRVTGFFNLKLHLSLAKGKQFKIRVQNV